MSTNPLVTSIQSPQSYYEIHSSERFKGLCLLLDMNAQKSCIVFCRTKKDVDHISEKLSLLNYRAASYHGDLSPTARDKAISSFVDKTANILVLTDIPASMDGFPNIDLIVFSVIPQDPDSYIQRIMRIESSFTVSEVATLISSNEFKKIAFIKRVTKSTIEHRQFLSPEEMIDLKKQTMIASLSDFSDDDCSDQLLAVRDALIAEHDPKTIVSFLLNSGFNQSFNLESYEMNLKQTQDAKRKTKQSSPDLPSGGERLFIALGKADGINDQMLIDFLHSETSIQKDHFSEIKIFETFSFFVVANDEAEIVLEIFRRKKRGKRSIVERAKGKDSPKKK